MSDNMETSSAPNEEPIFRALLAPHRSLGRKGFTVLMAALVTCWLFVGTLFYSIGAWPVFGFFGLDILLIYLAFRANYLAARAREEVVVSRTALDIRQIAATGRRVEYRLNPFWTRFRVSRHSEIGITAMKVEGEGKSISIGSFLPPDDRERFALAFSKALATAKGR